MARVPYANCNGQLSVEVQLKNHADVFLVDYSNYQKFKSGNSFKYHGGHYTDPFVRITVSGSGRWYLIVIGSDYKYRFC